MIRIGIEGRKSRAPAVLWLGVLPKSLTNKKGYDVAVKCKQLLMNHSILDVECEVGESMVSRGAGPKFLKTARTSDRTADIRIPLTATLGQPIFSTSNPYAEGTLGFFIQQGKDRKRVFAVTAGHVLFEGKENSEVYLRKNVSQPALKVRLLRQDSDKNLMENIEDRIEEKRCLIDYEQKMIKNLKGQESEEAGEERDDSEKASRKYQDAVKDLIEFKDEAEAGWSTPTNRTIGSIYLSPPVGSIYPGPYSQDWAIIELDVNKFDRGKFKGNVIDLGTKIPMYDFKIMMHPSASSLSGFVYPPDRLLRIHGKIPLRRCETLQRGTGMTSRA